MEENKKLYPFKFIDIEDTFPWGTETHQIADLGYRDTQIRNGWLACNSINEVMDMYMDRIVGEDAFEYYGRQFPVGVKVIGSTLRSPLVVHPDDTVAEERYDFLGKAKYWYVTSVKPGARIYLGFEKDTCAREFYAKCLDNSADDLLHVIEPKPGDGFFIRPGTVHAAEGVSLIEISEASPLDFCLCSWGQEVSEDEFDSALSIIEALDFIDYKAYVPAEKPVGKLVEEQEFTLTRLDLKDPLHIIAGENGGFALYSCVKGEATIQVRNEKSNDNYTLCKGETMLVPSEVDDFFLIPVSSDTVLLETMVERKVEQDPYIDPSAEPELPGEGEEFKFNSVYGRFGKN